MAVDPSLVVAPYEVPYINPIAETGIASDIATTFVASVIEAEAFDWLGLAKHFAKHGWSGAIAQEIVAIPFQKLLADKLVRPLAEGAINGGGEGPIVDHPAGVNEYATTYANLVSDQIASESARALETTANQSLNLRLPVPVVATRLQETFGMNERDAKTYNTKAASTSTMFSGKSLRDLNLQYIAERAATIGHQEAIGAINMGRQLRLVQANFKDPKAKKVWVTAVDERVCPICKPMDGVAVLVASSFEVQLPLPKTHRGKNRKSMKLLVPPAHVGCRCTVVSQDHFIRGIITRTARFESNESLRGRTNSSAADLISV